MQDQTKYNYIKSSVSNFRNSTNRIGNFNPGSDYAKCLVPLLDAIGWSGDHAQLIESLSDYADKMDYYDILNTMANLKFESHEMKCRIRHIEGRFMPCLFVSRKRGAHVFLKREDNHILAFNGETSEYIKLPVTREKGKTIFFKMIDDGSEKVQKRGAKWFFTILNRFRRIFFIIFSLTFILTLLALVSPLLVMMIYDQVLTSNTFSKFGMLGVGIGVYIIANTGFSYLRTQLMNYFSIRLGNIVSNQIFNRLLYLPPLFTESASLSSQISRIKDFDTVRDFFAGPAFRALIDMPFIIALIAAMFFFGGTIVYVPIGAMILFFVLYASVKPFIKRNNTLTAESMSKKQELVVETFTNFRAVKYTGTRNYWVERYKKLSADATLSSYYSSRLSSLINTLTQSIVSLAGIGTIAIGVVNVINGTMTTGALFASVFLIWRILSPIKSGFSVMTQTNKINNSIKQIDRLMNMVIEKKPENAMKINKKITGQIKFSRVSIRYTPESHPALLGVRFSAEPGELVLLTGHDGAGKSTVLKLILGLYSPQAGQIIIDGMNLKQIDPVTLRKSISYVPEFDQFFSGTIGYNIRLANPAATDRELTEAGYQAGLRYELDYIPYFFTKKIGMDNLEQFSSSLKKRLSFARAYLRKSNILLFDEPEKGLNENEIQDFINELNRLKGKTTILLASNHPAFFKIADKSIWLDKGRVKMDWDRKRDAL